MSFIEKQTALVAQIKPLYLKRFKGGIFGGQSVGFRSKYKRIHMEAMTKAGYTKTEAIQSANDCDDMAQLEAMCEATEQSLGLTA